MEKYLFIRPFFKCTDGSIYFYISEDEVVVPQIVAFHPLRCFLVTDMFWNQYPKYKGCSILEERIKILLEQGSSNLLTIIFMEYKYASKLVRRANIQSPVIPITSIAMSIDPNPTYFDSMDFYDQFIFFSENTQECAQEIKSGDMKIYPWEFKKETSPEIFGEKNLFIEIQPYIKGWASKEVINRMN